MNFFRLWFDQKRSYLAKTGIMLFNCMLVFCISTYSQVSKTATFFLEFNIGKEMKNGEFQSVDTGTVGLSIIGRDGKSRQFVSPLPCSAKVFKIPTGCTKLQLILPELGKNYILNIPISKRRQLHFFRVQVSIDPDAKENQYVVQYQVGHRLTRAYSREPNRPTDTVTIETLSLISSNGKTGTGAIEIDKCLFN